MYSWYDRKTNIYICQVGNSSNLRTYISCMLPSTFADVYGQLIYIMYMIYRTYIYFTIHEANNENFKLSQTELTLTISITIYT